jgi:photosystem II stability/assembly factor-like uncharacterized protein
MERAGQTATILTGLGAVALAFVVSPACSAGPPQRPVSRPSLLDTSQAAAPLYPSPASWRYHPREASTLFAESPLGDGRTLYAGQRGERWLVDPKAGTADAAALLAPEDLVAVARKGKGQWLFVGRSGTSYETATPLGEFVRGNAPLESLAHVSAAGSSLYGLRRDGTLRRSEDAGASWSRVGPEAVRFEDVVVDGDGHGLALSVPEALWETKDYGASFQRLDVPRIAAEALVLDGSAGLVVATPLGARRFTPGPSPRLVPLGRPVTLRSHALAAPPPLGPSAASLVEGRAIVERDRWVEARLAPSGAWNLVTGAFGGRLAVAALPPSKGCTEVRLAGFGSTLYLACARQKGRGITQPFELSRSTDGGKTWIGEPYVPEGQTESLVLAVGTGDNLVASGVCPAEARGPGCRPSGVHLRRSPMFDAGPKLALVPAATPSLSGPAFGTVFSLDGRTLYVLGRRSKGESFTVFVSRDGGTTFDARDVESLPAPSDERAGARTVLESAAPAEDGTVAFVVSSRGHRSWLVVDEDGRAIAVSRPPTESARIGAVGQRGLAFEPSSRESWESLDGGASWTSLGRLPVDPCPGIPAGACQAPIACVAHGCLIGDVLSRIGWREPDHAAVLAPPAAPDVQRRLEKHLGATLSCALDAGEWRRITGVPQLPTAVEAAIGKAVWIARRVDPATASVSVVQVRPGATTAIEETVLLPPKPRAEEFAYASSGQVEGVAAVRYVRPGLGSSKDPTLRGVEVAWDDVLFGKVGHGTIADGGGYRIGDFVDGKGPAKLAQPALLSIAHGGVYVRLHGPLGDAQATFFVDGSSAEAVPPAVFSSEDHRRWDTEVARLGRAHVPVWIDGATVVRARRGNGPGWLFDGASMGFTSPAEFGLGEQTGIAYVGEKAALQVVTSDVAGREAHGLLYPFRADGALFDEPTRIPTQVDLGASPRGCTPSDLATPRVVMPYQPGTRRAVLVTDAVEPMRILLTGAAVLHGTPESPCVAAYEAVLVSSELSGALSSEQAILPMANPERSWLFRKVEGLRDAATALEYRTMSCRVDREAEVPPEVFRERGTLAEPR